MFFLFLYAVCHIMVNKDFQNVNWFVFGCSTCGMVDGRVMVGHQTLDLIVVGLVPSQVTVR